MRNAKPHSDGYGYIQPRENYRRHARSLDPSMCQVHYAGDTLFVDFRLHTELLQGIRRLSQVQNRYVDTCAIITCCPHIAGGVPKGAGVEIYRGRVQGVDIQ